MIIVELPLVNKAIEILSILTKLACVGVEKKGLIQLNLRAEGFRSRGLSLSLDS